MMSSPGFKTLAVFASLLLLSLSARANAAAPDSQPVVPATNLTVLPGFKAELLRTALPNEGSWVCMTVDDKGRLIISPQDLSSTNAMGKPKIGGLLRMTIIPGGGVERVEQLRVPVGAAMGLLYAFNSLYVSGQGPEGTGLYRLRDTQGTGQFDEAKLLKQFEGNFRNEAAGEHGPHAIVLGPDNMLYVINGNETKVVSGILPNSPHKNYQPDQLLPPQLWPPNYTWANNPPPAGCVYRTDPDGKEWTLICGGLRNSYDLAFNRDGEMFTYDNDMDWDIGTPWYRPNRVNHLVSGGEYGWRRGTGKWPEYYPDSLKPNLETPRSSPTGVKFGTNALFPRKYRDALYICDWAFGTLYAVHLTPSGATYKMTAEPFVVGKPLNITDVEIGHDGAMYFTTGGRGTQASLYRVSYTEKISKQVNVWGEAEQVGLKSRALRHQLEAYHGKKDPAAVDFAWPYLDDGDRWLRYAARIAIEWQDVSLWQERALSETKPIAAINALLALARCGDKSVQPQLLDSLGRLKADQLSEEHVLDALRVLELCLIRMGDPDTDTTAEIVRRLEAHYPAQSDFVNREICSLLVRLNDPGVVAKSMSMLASTPAQEQQMAYAFALRNMKVGWTREQRIAYFQWFPYAAQHNTGSDKFIGFLKDTRRDAITTLSAEEQKDLAAYLNLEIAPAVVAAVPQRAFVKEWKMDDLLPLLPKVSSGRSFERGQKLFTEGQCVLCHRFGNTGGAIGPDLTAVASRFSRHDILEAIVLPSKVIPDQFQNTTVIKKDGDDVTGRILAEDDQKLVISPNPLSPDKVEVLKKDIKERKISKISPMPEGLLNVLNEDEVLDLIAFLESGGKADYSAFKK